MADPLDEYRTAANFPDLGPYASVTNVPKTPPGDPLQRYYAPPPTSWPTKREIEDYRAAGMGYGSPMERYMAGQEARVYRGVPVVSLAGRNFDDAATDILAPWASRYETNERPWPSDLSRQGLAYTGAHMAGARSALVALGLDPARFAVSTRDKGVNLGGLYDPRSDTGYAGASVDNMAGGLPGQTLAHEAVHRALNILRTDLRTAALAEPYLNDRGEEEAVRSAMWMLGGAHVPLNREGVSASPEALARVASGRDPAYYGLGRRAGEGVFPLVMADRDRAEDLTDPERVMALELLASALIAHRRPRGPR